MIGIVLAGGAAKRMGGGDKGSLTVGGLPILDRVVSTLRGQCDEIVISANGDPARFARFDARVIPDNVQGGGQGGPLAGVCAALDAIAAFRPDACFAVTVPTDTPFLPEDLVARLDAVRTSDGAVLAQARSGGHLHPVAAVWAIVLRADLRNALEQKGLRKAQLFFARHAAAVADWPTVPYDPFFNVNTPADLAAAEAIASGIGQDRLAVPGPLRL